MFGPHATEQLMPGIAVSEGALEVSNIDVGDRLISRNADAGRRFRDRSGGMADRSGPRPAEDRSLFPRCVFSREHSKSTAANTCMAWRRWRSGRAREFSKRRRWSASTHPEFASASSRRRRGCAPRTSFWPATSISARRRGGCRRRCCRSGAMPAITEPLGDRLSEAIAFTGSVIDSDGVDQFRIVDGDRLMWASPETTWDARPQRFASPIARRIRTIFPQLGEVEIADVWGGAIGQTVHGMPQIGQLRRGLWVRAVSAGKDWVRARWRGN